jgi:serine O-acetyltransferase
MTNHRNTQEDESGVSRFDAIALHHIAHWLYLRSVPILPRFCDYLIFLLFNSVIPHTASIGKGTRCGYRGMSVVIHPDALVGRRVLIGAHVVIGGRSGQKPPIIEDGVYIGANACVLGDIRIGKDAIVGAGAVVLRHVPAGTRVVGNPARVLDRGPTTDVTFGGP